MPSVPHILEGSGPSLIHLTAPNTIDSFDTLTDNSFHNAICNHSASSLDVGGFGQHTIKEERLIDSDFHGMFLKDSFEYSKPRLISHHEPLDTNT